MDESNFKLQVYKCIRTWCNVQAYMYSEWHNDQNGWYKFGHDSGDPHFHGEISAQQYFENHGNWG